MHEIRNKQGIFTDADFWAQWDSSTPRMCLMIKVTSRATFGSEVVAFTSNSRDMTMPGHPDVVFKASPALTPTTIETGLDEPTNLEMTGIYNSDSFDQVEVLAGKWDFAAIEIFSACWDNTDLGEFVHFKGWLAEFKDYQTHFTAEGRGPIARLSNDVTKVTSRLCRVKEFGDDECKRDLDVPVTIDGDEYDLVQTSLPAADNVEAWVGALTFSNSDFNGNVPPDHFYKNGKITGVTGNNAGVSREIADSFNNALDDLTDILLKRRMPFDVLDTDTYTLTAGCDRTIEMCLLYENVLNRRAEDYIPGLEAANRVPVSN